MQEMNTVEDLLLRLHDMHGKMSVTNTHKSLVELTIQVVWRQAELLNKLSTELQQAQKEQEPRVSLA
jgi:tRNA(Phe) wybutosine-synthesizing methylase Tyw3